MSSLIKKYPCNAVFSQLYVVPRHHFDLRFCSYHKPILVMDQDAVFRAGIAGLQGYFNQNEELNRRRAAYLAEDYIDGAGCSPDCYWYCTWKMSGDGFSVDEFLNDNNTFALRKLWLSVGPDCNIVCRYCLDPENFHIDYNTCDTRSIALARDFVAAGGQVLLTGGEPFLPKFKLVEALEDLAGREGVEGNFEIHTNATFLNKEVRELILRSPIRSIDISIDTLRADTFEYLRKGAKFDNVWGNACALRRERDERGFKRPDIVVLCAVMKDNFHHIVETVDGVVAEGMTISLNALFKAYYSPDFCLEHGLHLLTLNELEKLLSDIAVLEQKYGPDGPVGYQGLKGQVLNLILTSPSGSRQGQVELGHGGEAIRKAGFFTSVTQGRYRVAVRDVARKLYWRMMGLSGK